MTLAGAVPQAVAGLADELGQDVVALLGDVLADLLAGDPAVGEGLPLLGDLDDDVDAQDVLQDGPAASPLPGLPGRGRLDRIGPFGRLGLVDLAFELLVGEREPVRRALPPPPRTSTGGALRHFARSFTRLARKTRASSCAQGPGPREATPGRRRDVHRPRLARLRPGEGQLLQPLVEDPEARAVPHEDLQPVATWVAEGEGASPSPAASNRSSPIGPSEPRRIRDHARAGKDGVIGRVSSLFTTGSVTYRQQADVERERLHTAPMTEQIAPLV